MRRGRLALAGFGIAAVLGCAKTLPPCPVPHQAPGAVWCDGAQLLGCGPDGRVRVALDCVEAEGPGATCNDTPPRCWASLPRTRP